MVVIRMRSRTARTLSSCQAGKTGQGKARQDGPATRKTGRTMFCGPRDGGECLAEPRTLPLLCAGASHQKSFGKEVKEGCGTPVGIIGQILLPCRPPVEPVAKWPRWVCDATRRGGV